MIFYICIITTTIIYLIILYLYVELKLCYCVFFPPAPSHQVSSLPVCVVIVNMSIKVTNNDYMCVICDRPEHKLTCSPNTFGTVLP